MAQRILLWLTDRAGKQVRGDNRSKGYVNWIELEDISTAPHRSGLGSGVVAAGPGRVWLTKPISGSSPALARMMKTGEQPKYDAFIDWVEADPHFPGRERTFRRVTLSRLTLVNQRVLPPPHGGAVREQFEIACGKLEVKEASPN